ncbi:MAG: hypothetical protein ACFB2X_05485 [Rivularia sp. (in: cyanobacteria)]
MKYVDATRVVLGSEERMGVKTAKLTEHLSVETSRGRDGVRGGSRVGKKCFGVSKSLIYS